MVTMRYPARPVGRSVLDGLAKSLTLAHQALNLLAQAPSSRQRLPILYPKDPCAAVLPYQTVRATVHSSFCGVHRRRNSEHAGRAI